LTVLRPEPSIWRIWTLRTKSTPVCFINLIFLV
jgi:hypothetical protein